MMNPETRRLLGYQLIEQKRELNQARSDVSRLAEKLGDARRTQARMESVVADLAGDLDDTEDDDMLRGPRGQANQDLL